MPSTHITPSSTYKKRRKGLQLNRFFTEPEKNPFDQVSWERRTATLTGANGRVVFEQKDVEFPSFWSDLATNIVTQKYFRGPMNSKDREYSLKQLISRVVDTITSWGETSGYFAGPTGAATFSAELTHLLLHQMMSFNSTVWFNVGRVAKPQSSSCFILSVQDSIDNLCELQTDETHLFSHGSGSGSNLSTLREHGAPLSRGGTASGPISFMRALDSWAGTTKSGGSTRHAALMRVLNIDHPDVEEFIQCKAESEKMAHALIDAGFDGAFNGKVYRWMPFQNANNSVRVSDEFMQAVEQNKPWTLYSVVSGQPTKTLPARDLFRQIAEAAWICGDPGLHFDTTINDWHPTPLTARQNATNSCSEFSFMDDSACNLASLNLHAFQKADGSLDLAAFRQAVEITLLAQEIIVGLSGYPTEKVTHNSLAFRPLGLGFTNLGSMLMSIGLPYDSEEGRNLAASLTALMTGYAYSMSAKIARDATGPFTGYEKNQEPFLRVIQKHKDSISKEPDVNAKTEIIRTAAIHAWEEAYDLGTKYGFRNAQVTVLAPTGTISFMMDCDTTGIEPDLSLIKHKHLVGGGFLTLVNSTVSIALARLGYTEEAIAAILAYLKKEETIEGAPLLLPEHVAVFDCAICSARGKRFIQAEAHLRMMAAVQPFLSGGISKTVNMPHECTIEEIEQTYLLAWQLKLKSVAIYRDGCKRNQPLSSNATLSKDKAATSFLNAATLSHEELIKQLETLIPTPKLPLALRKELPNERASLTHAFSVLGNEGTIHVSLFEDGRPGEIFVRMAQTEPTISGLLDVVSNTVSVALQHGVPLSSLVNQFNHTLFESPTQNPELPDTNSILAYVFQWLEQKFPPQSMSVDPKKHAKSSLSSADKWRSSVGGMPVEKSGPSESKKQPGSTKKPGLDSPLCTDCGNIMVPTGSCYCCTQCGKSSGCS